MRNARLGEAQAGIKMAGRNIKNLRYAGHIMRNTRLGEAQAGIKMAGRNISNFQYADDITLMVESEEELKILLMVKEESEKAGLNSAFKK